MVYDVTNKVRLLFFEIKRFKSSGGGVVEKRNRTDNAWGGGEGLHAARCSYISRGFEERASAAFLLPTAHLYFMLLQSRVLSCARMYRHFTWLPSAFRA